MCCSTYTVPSHPRADECRQGFVTLTLPHGYIAGPLYDVVNGELLPCLWRIEGAQGQNVNLTLWDFDSSQTALTGSNDDSSASFDMPPCTALYATITEKLTPSSQPVATKICGDGRRRHHAMTSSSNVVDIRLFPMTKGSDTSQQHQRRNFVLEYESKRVQLSDIRFQIDSKRVKWYSQLTS